VNSGWKNYGRFRMTESGSLGNLELSIVIEVAMIGKRISGWY
jgi:hypothetical protein